MNPYPNQNYLPPATAIYTPANPAAPASTSVFAQQGLGSLLTPVLAPGLVLVNIMGTLVNSGTTTVGEGIILQLNYGPMVTGVAAPANAAAAPASAVNIGNPVEWATGVTLTTAADLFQAVNLTGLVKGLIPGQQYWFDLAAKSVIGASIISITNVTVVLVEHG